MRSLHFFTWLFVWGALWFSAATLIFAALGIFSAACLALVFGARCAFIAIATQAEIEAQSEPLSMMLREGK